MIPTRSKNLVCGGIICNDHEAVYLKGNIHEQPRTKGAFQDLGHRAPGLICTSEKLQEEVAKLLLQTRAHSGMSVSCGNIVSTHKVNDLYELDSV